MFFIGLSFADLCLLWFQLLAKSLELFYLALFVYRLSFTVQAFLSAHYSSPYRWYFFLVFRLEKNDSLLIEFSRNFINFSLMIVRNNNLCFAERSPSFIKTIANLDLIGSFSSVSDCINSRLNILKVCWLNLPLGFLQVAFGLLNHFCL